MDFRNAPLAPGAASDPTPAPGPAHDPSGRRIDPADWDRFREEARRAVDLMVDHLAERREVEAWHAPDPLAVARIAGAGPPREPTPLAELLDELARDVVPHSMGNTTPRFYGWVSGSGTGGGALAEMLGAAMNSNCGGRDHISAHVERTVIDWTRQVMGFPEGSSGILMAGTSAATVIAFVCARHRASGGASRTRGNGAARWRVYARADAHKCVRNALEILGIGSDALRLVPAPPDGGMEVDVLDRMIAEDRAAGDTPFAVVGSAGTVDTGAYDDLDALADVAEREGAWFHVDGAFGAWIRLAGGALGALGDGIGRADSLALDYHKWIGVPYDCGLALLRDGALHREAFGGRPSYLEGAARGTAGGEPWFCDFGIDLSRGFRALKVWVTLREHGLDRWGEVIADNCAHARLMADLAREHAALELMHEVTSCVCCFRAVWPGATDEEHDARNAALSVALQESGEAVLSTTRVRGRTALRAAIVNHRTTRDDVRRTVAKVTELAVGMAA